MKTFNENEIKVIRAALLYYAAHQEDIISSHYLDVDNEQFVEESQKILEEANSLYDYFYSSKTFHTLKSDDIDTINEAFTTADRLYESSTDFVLKAGMYLGLIDGIKAIIMRKNG